MATVFKTGRAPVRDDEFLIEDITRDASGHPAFDRHETVVRVSDKSSGLEAIIALHDTTLGPAMGGTRVWPYENADAALTDVLRLSRAMTLKAAMAGVQTGGGKAVIIADPATDKSEALLRAYGRAVESLGGRFITGEDVGLTVADADAIATETSHVMGTSGRAGDPAPATAYGVYLGIRAAARRRLKREDLAGLRIAVQGLGNVGRSLVELLSADRAVLSVADIDEAAVERTVQAHGVKAVTPDRIYDCDADIFAPCAMGGVINDDTLVRLSCAIVAGSANNQLLEPRHGLDLHDRGILYAPDYVINGGGLIALSLEMTDDGYSWERAREKVDGIGATLEALFEAAVAENLPPERIADRMAFERIAAASRSGQSHAVSVGGDAA